MKMMNRNDIGYIFVQYINDPNNGKKRPILIIRDSDEMLKFYNGLKHFDHLSENDIFRFESFIKTH